MNTDQMGQTSTEAPIDHNDDLVHLVCECNPDVAFCGAQIPGDNWIADGFGVERDCVVCLDLNNEPCGRCGCVDD